MPSNHQEKKKAESCFTSKITAPRATHFAIFQFFSRNLEIMSKSPVLSLGISCYRYHKSYYYLSLSKQKTLAKRIPTSFQLLSKNMNAATPSSTKINKTSNNEYCTDLRYTIILERQALAMQYNLLRWYYLVLTQLWHK